MKIVIDVPSTFLASGTKVTEAFVRRTLVNAFSGIADFKDDDTRDFLNDLIGAKIQLKDPPADRVIINGTLVVLKQTNKTLDYAKVVTLAGYDPQRILTVCWSHGPLDAREGILTPGQTIPVVDGMRFSVADTSNA